MFGDAAPIRAVGAVLMGGKIGLTAKHFADMKTARIKFVLPKIKGQTPRFGLAETLVAGQKCHNALDLMRVTAHRSCQHDFCQIAPSRRLIPQWQPFSF